MHLLFNSFLLVRLKAIIACGGGLKFYLGCFIYFLFQCEISEMHRPIGAKFCTLVSTRSSFIMPVQNFGGPPQTNFWGQNMQNLARFWMPSKFGGKYLRNGWRYSKSNKYFIYRDSSRVRRNKSGEVWSSNLGDLDVKSYPPIAHFSEEHISAPRGCCTPKFSHALENDEVLLAHPYRGWGPPLQFF